MSTSQRTPNTIQNWSQLIDLVMRIELTRAILMPRFSNFLRNSTIHFDMCLYLVPYFLRVTVSLLCRSQGRTISSSFTYKRWINWTARVNSILTAKFINLLKFCAMLGSVVTEGDIPCIVHLYTSLSYCTYTVTCKTHKASIFIDAPLLMISYNLLRPVSSHPQLRGNNQRYVHIHGMTDVLDCFRSGHS